MYIGRTKKIQAENVHPTKISRKSGARHPYKIFESQALSAPIKFSMFL